MPKPKKRKPKLDKDSQEPSREEILDELALFEEWKRFILPELRRSLLKGTSAKDIAKAFENYAAARAVTIAITEPDSSKALAAIKDIQDRASGKPTETKKIQHQYHDMTDEEVEAMLQSEEEDLAIINDNKEPVQ